MVPIPDINHYAFDIFLSYPWEDPECAWVSEVFKPTLQHHLKGTFRYWETRIYSSRSAPQIGSPLSATLRRNLLGSCVLVPVMCYPYFWSEWCAAEFRTFREPTLVTPKGASGRDRNIVPVIYDGDPESYPTHASKGAKLIYSVMEAHHLVTFKGRTKKFDSQVREIAKSISKMLNVDPGPDPLWPAFDDDSMVNLKKTNAAQAADWLIVQTPSPAKPSFQGAA
ncbi:MAG: toll/interleukin-1 receptor domain-containing protein [Phycisphaerales bacterium]|nr:toll/interleukin-1 receptor domain-containing protein [Phycisphaerales bacterium]